MFLHNFTQCLENWICEVILTGADLTKIVKICIISICAKKIFFGKIICSTHQRKCFSTILRNFWKIEFSKDIDRRAPYKNGEYLNYLKLCKENIFCQNYLFHLSKEVFLHNFRQFLENWIFEGILTGANLTKMVKICIILNCAKKIFLAKLFVPLIKGSVPQQFYSILGKLNFWRNIDRRGPYKNGENLYYLNLC